MGLTVTEDTPADMLAGNMELLVQLPPRSDNDYDDNYDEEEEALHHQHHRNHRDRHHNYHHNNGHHPRRATTNGINARRVTVARSTPMMDLLVQVATSQKLSASSYTLEAIGEHGLVLTHHPNTPIGALDALQVKLLPKQGTFAPVKPRHANQPFEPTFRLQVHLPRNQLYVSRVSSRMNLGKILEEVCREKNLDRSNYELCHPANLEEKLDLSLSLQDYHLQEVTLCPKRRSLGSSLSSQDIMALQRQEERRRQDARHTVFGFAFKKSKESSVSTDSLGERSISPARSDGTGRSASPLQVPTAPKRPQRKRRPAPKPPILQREQEQHSDLDNGLKETGKEREIEKEKIVVISHSRNSSDSSGYHEASVLSDNLDSNIRIPETLPRRGKAQPQPLEPPPRTLAETSQASKSLGNLAFVPTNNRPSIARGTSNTSLVSTGLRKKKAAPAPPQPRPLSSAISTQALERIVDSEESLTSGGDSSPAKASSDVAGTSRPSLVTSQSLSSDDSEPITVTISKMETENNNVANPPSPEVVVKKEEPIVVEKPTPKKRSTVVQPFVAIAESRDQFDVAETATEIVTHNVEPARDRKRGELVPVPKPRNKLVTTHTPISESPKVQPSRQLEVPIINKSPMHKEIIETPATNTRDLHVESTRRFTVGSDNKNDEREELRLHSLTTYDIDWSVGPSSTVAKENNFSISQEMISDTYGEHNDHETSQRHGTNQAPKKPRRKTLGGPDPYIEEKSIAKMDVTEKQVPRTSEVTNVIIQSWDSTVNQAVRSKRVSKKFALLQKKFEEPQSLPIYLTTDIKRSCAVISTIPKCDHFEGPITMGKNASPSIDEKKNSSLGLSFGARAGKFIWDSSYQRDDEKSAGKTLKMTNMAGDELELEDISLEMFEESKRPWDRSKLLRSNSVLNNYEINTFENSGRALTSKSVDFTFALNPNLSRNISDLSTDSYPEKYSKKYFSKDDGVASKDIDREWRSSSATDSPQFFRRGISWDRRQVFLSAEGQEYEAGKVSTADEGRTDLTTPITGAEATSELLKKVSDTLSGSSRSPTVALISTSGNVSPKHQQQLKVSVDPPEESRIRINQPQTIAEGNIIRGDVTNSNEKSLDDKSIESNIPDDLGRAEIKDGLQNSVQNESFVAAETTDWEYQLPEPPTAFRDREENENRKGSSTISLEKGSTDVESTDLAVNYTDSEISNNVTSPTLNEKTKSRKDEVVSATQSPKSSTSINEAINSDANFQSRTLDSVTLERGRISRSGTVKPLGDSTPRRSSHAVSTPSVAPVDNPLSNFTITTYSRPKPVEIFNEIEQRDDEPQPGILGRKGSAGQTELFAAVPQQNRRHTATAIFVTKNASQSSKTYMTLPRNEKNAEPEITPKKIEPVEATVMKEIDDQRMQINSDANNTNVSRSNVRISIASKPRPRANTLTEIVLSKNKTLDVINGNEAIRSNEEQRKDSVPESYDKFSQSGENISNKQESPDKEEQLQSLEILKSILPQLDDARKTSRDDRMSENTDSVPSKETSSLNDTKNEPSTDENPKNSVPTTAENTKINEPKMKRYTYSGPPAIDLGSWSERSRTKVQIKPDSDYKFEKSKSPEIITPAQTTPAPIIRANPSNAGPKIGTTSVIIQNETPAPVFPVQPVGITAAKNARFEKDCAAEIENRDRKESNELAKTLIARTTATGFTRRPVSAMFEPSGVSTLTRLRKKEPEEQKVVGTQGRVHNQTPEKDEIDSTPINFKQLKETFGKEQLTNSQSRPNYGTYGRPKSEYITSGSTLRRDSNVTLSNGESERVAPISNYSTLQRISTNGPARVMSGAENTKVQEKSASVPSQEKRNFVVSTNRVGYNQVSEPTGPGGVRRTSRGNLMPVVKGFKVTTLEGEGAVTLPNNKDKQPNNYGRVAIGDISNGNYVATHNGLKKTVVQIRGDDFTNGIPKPPPTMPVITGVTLKSTNANNSRPKSIGGQADPRSELLEAIKGFGGTNQLRRVPRRSMNISGIQI